MGSQEVHDPETEVLVGAQVLALGDQTVRNYYIECCAEVNKQYPDIYIWVWLRLYK